MGSRRGSALVLAMLLLVLLSAAGVYVFSRSSVPPGEGPIPFHRAAVARNMARAGAHAAIARLPAVPPDGAKYGRNFPVGPNLSGAYSVVTRETAQESGETGGGTDGTYVVYEIVSEGNVSGFPGETARVRAVVRFGPIPSSAPRVKIRKWEEPFPG